MFNFSFDPTSNCSTMHFWSIFESGLKSAHSDNLKVDQKCNSVDQNCNSCSHVHDLVQILYWTKNHTLKYFWSMFRPLPVQISVEPWKAHMNDLFDRLEEFKNDYNKVPKKMIIHISWHEDEKGKALDEKKVKKTRFEERKFYTAQKSSTLDFI